MNKRFLLLLVAVPLCAAAALPYTFQSGQTISAAEINANFTYLNSRIDALSPSSGTITSKVGAMVPSGQPPAVVLANSGTAPLEILEASAIQGSSPQWYVTCGTGTPGAGSSQLSLKYLAPGCTILVRDLNAVLQSGQSYVLTYRQ